MRLFRGVHADYPRELSTTWNIAALTPALILAKLRAELVSEWSVSMRSMLDHLARARELRRQAAKCQQAAKTSVSPKFGDCYRLLANNYVILAELEEDFVARANSVLLQNRLIAAE